MAETSNETSYDIFEWFPIGVCQNIFQYLDGKNVIQASAVNKEWYKLCAESEQAKKLKLVLCDARNHILTNGDVELLKNSKRKYQHIVIGRLNTIEVSSILPFFLKRGGSWKSVQLDSYWKDREMWSELIRIIEPSVEELTVARPMELPEVVYSNWTFPCLKVLQGGSVSSKICKMFVHCTTLVKLNWMSLTGESIKDLSKVLRNNHNLKDLAVSAEPLLEHPTEFRFKLDKLVMYGYISDQTDLVALHAFLETQAQTLKSLKISARLNRACLELILSMPKLSSFTTVSAEHSIVLVNTTITSLEFTDVVCSRNREAFESLVRSLTSLKHFKCFLIHDDDFDFLAREVPALESFAADFFYVSRFSEGDIFPNLKEFRVRQLSHGLQEPTGDHNFAKLVRKAMR